MPSTSNVLDEALDLVKKRLAELDEERKRLERALAELGGAYSPPGRPGRPPGSGRGPGRPGKLQLRQLAKPHPNAVVVAAAPAPIRR